MDIVTTGDRCEVTELDTVPRDRILALELVVIELSEEGVCIDKPKFGILNPEKDLSQTQMMSMGLAPQVLSKKNTFSQVAEKLLGFMAKNVLIVNEQRVLDFLKAEFAHLKSPVALDDVILDSLVTGLKLSSSLDTLNFFGALKSKKLGQTKAQKIAEIVIQRLNHTIDRGVLVRASEVVRASDARKLAATNLLEHIQSILQLDPSSKYKYLKKELAIDILQGDEVEAQVQQHTLSPTSS